MKIAPTFLYQKIKDIIYPRVCCICECFNEEYICPSCYKKIEKDIKPKLDSQKDKCFAEHLYIFKYKDWVRREIIKYKFYDAAYLSDLFTKIILKNEKICSILEKYDIMIPVPIHKKRKAQRGYNQSELIAKKVANSLQNIELATDVLIKIKNNVPQSSLTKKQRMDNAKGVYKIQKQEKIKDKNIVLFDDIYTTGNTANECAKKLIENGAKSVLVFTIAKD